jgi:hypothetical protein
LSGAVYHYLSQDYFLGHRAAVVDARGAEAFPDCEWCSGRHKLDPLARGVEIQHTRRYCQHHCGHVIAALSYAAAALGWRTRLVEAAADDAMANSCVVDARRPPAPEMEGNGFRELNRQTTHGGCHKGSTSELRAAKLPASASFPDLRLSE